MSGFRRRIPSLGQFLFCILYVVTVIIFSIPMSKKADADSIIYKDVATASTGTGTSTSLTINMPTATISGDVMIASLGSASADATFTSSGWTSIIRTNNTTLVTVQSFYKVAGASEAGPYTFDTGTSGSRLAGAITTYRGVSNASPVDLSGGGSTGTGTANVLAGTITTTVSRTRVIGAFAIDDANPRTYTFSSPNTTMTERADVSSSHAVISDVSVAMGDISQAAAGATGNQTAVASGTGRWAGHQIALKPDGTTHMMLLWDGTGSAPTGWSFVTEFDGKFIRGDEPANFGATGGTATHNHTSTASITGITNNNPLLAGIGTAVSSNNHTHTTPTVTFDAANNSPAHRTLRLIRYDAGIPNIIPANAISIFDSSPGIPSGWIEQTARRDLLIKINSTDTSCMTSTCGSDNHTHNINWTNLTAASGSANRLQITGTATATTTHTHTVNDSTSASASFLPPYVQPLIAKANTDIELTSIGLTAFFDGDPGGGWIDRSVSGQPFYQQFLRPAETYNGTSQGASTHNHGTSTHESLGNTGTGGNTTDLGSDIASDGHRHSLSVAASSTSNHVPEYFSIVVAEKVNFIQAQYAWYEDNDANLPTSRWGGLDTAHNSAILTLPAGSSGNDPPDLNKELRLRIQILANNNNLGVNEIQYRLQFKEGTDGNCTTGTWTDVGNNADSTIWKYATSSVGDGSTLSGGVGFSPVSNKMQRYVKSKSAGTNPNAVNVGERMEWDYHIMHNGALGATKYSFRLVEDVGGLLLSQYGDPTPDCPTLSTKPQPVNQLRHGNFFESDGSEKGFSWVD